MHSSDNCAAILILFHLYWSLCTCSRHSRIKDPELSDKNSQYLIGQGNTSRTCTLNHSSDLQFIHVGEIIFNVTGLSVAHGSVTFLLFHFPRFCLSPLSKGLRFISTLSPTKTLMRQWENLPRKSMFPLSRLRRSLVLVSPSVCFSCD